MDFLFDKDRKTWVFKDRQARKVGAILDRDLTHGEALTEFDGKGVAQVSRVDRVEFGAQTVWSNTAGG